VDAVAEQFPGISIQPPSIEGRQRVGSAREFLRIEFRIWPGRGAAIETAFKQELVQTLNKQDPDYRDWMVTVNYEVEKPATRSRN
jgi:small conductance mechanosensitive channel